MKAITHLLTPPWKLMLSVLLITAWCSNVDAAYWNRTRAHSKSSSRDLDGDGIPNIVDPDIDNDGIPNALDRNVDGGKALTGPFAGEYIGDHIDNDNESEDDIDDDGLSNDSLAEKDIDGDGKQNDDPAEHDIDGDHRENNSTSERDIDGDHRDDDSEMEDDIDGDGLDDDDPLEHDIDGDGINNSSDDDIDGDGKLNNDPADLDIDGDGKQNDDPTDTDEDGDGIQDRNDNDDNNNGTPDIDEVNHHGEADEAEVQSDLAPVAAPGNSTARVTYRVLGTGAAKLGLNVRDAAVGSYDFVVGGTVRGTLSVVQEKSKTRGDLVFKTADSGSGDLLLNFAVAGQTIQLRQGSTVFFDGVCPTPGTSTNTGGVGTSQIALTRSPGLSAESEAGATLHFGTAGPIKLELELAKVPAGDYTVLIGEAARGTISVVTTATGLRGQLVFSTDGTPGSLPLSFATAGQSIALAQGSTTLFFGQLPTAIVPVP